MKFIAPLVLIAALANNASASSTVDQTRVEVKGPRVHAKDIFPGAIDIDLGPTPPIGASRIIEKGDIEKAYADAKAAPPKKIPAQVKVSRKTRKLTAMDIDHAVRGALASQKLPRGAELIKVRANATEIADDFDHVSVEVPPVPRKAGPATVQATVIFLGADENPIYRTIIPLDVALPPEAAFAEIAKGSSINVVVRRGLIEVSMPGTAALDADVGGMVQVMLKPSGRVLRCRAIDKNHALMVEE